MTLNEKTAEKTAGNGRKSARSPKNGAEIPLGAHPANTGGKPGRSGRPSNSFRDALAAVRCKPSVLAALEAAAADPISRNFAAAWKILTDYDLDRPGMHGEPAPDVLTREEREERVLAILRNAARRRRASMDDQVPTVG